MSSDNTLLISQEASFKKYYLSSLGANIAAFSIGTVLGYCSPGLFSLKQTTSKIHLDPYQESWFGSLVPLAALIGGLISGKTIETCGRQFTLMFSSVPMAIGWFIIALARDVQALFIGRFITGIALGLMNVAGPVYIAETTPPKVRGLFGLSFPLSMCLGVLYSYSIGYAESWPNLALYCLIVPSIQIIFMNFLPETPSWLINHNQIDRATENVIWLFGNDHNLLTLALLTNEEENDSNEKLKLFTEAKYRTPFLLCIMVMFIQQFSGINAIIFYTSTILQSAGSAIDPNLATIYIGLVQFLTVAISCVLVDRFGRKLLLYVSGLLMGVAMMIFSTYYFLDDEIKKNYSIVPLIALIIFIFSFAIGYGPVPWLLMSELIQNKVKGLATGLVTSFNFVCMFLIVWQFKSLAELIDFKFIYLALSLISFSSILFNYFFLPESKGKSLKELEEYFNSRSMTDRQEA